MILLYLSMKSILFSLVFLLIFWQGSCIYIFDQDQYQSLGFTGKKPHFQQPIYEAAAINTGSKDFLYLKNGPIIFENCASLNTSLKLDLDETKYKPVLNSLDTCEVFFFLFLKNRTSPGRFPLDFIFLRAVYEEHIVAMTTIVVMTKESSGSSNRIFDVDGTDYVILNYWHFKLFLATIFTISVLILCAEIRDLFLQYRSRRNYTQMSDTINYI